MLDRFLVDHRVALALAGEPVLLALILLGGFAFWRIGRGEPYGVPRDPRRRLLGAAALLLVLNGVAWLALLRGPLHPLMETTRRLTLGVGHPIPDIAFQRVPDGATVHLSELRGRVVLVNLWATWCPPCVVEMPELRALERRLGPAGLTVVAISDEPLARVLAFATQVPLPANAGSAPGFPWLPLAGYRPYSFIVDREGRLRGSVFGRLDEAAFEGWVRPWL